MPARQTLRSLRLTVLLCAILLPVLVAGPGCGGDSSADPTTTATTAVADGEGRPLVRTAREIEAADPPLSKASFLTRVNGLCRRAWPEIRDNLAAYGKGQDPDLSEERRFKQAVARSLLPQIESRMFDPIMAIGTPQQDSAELEEIMRWLGEAIEIGQGEYAITTPVLVWDLFDIFNPLVRKYGLGECLVNARHTGFEG